MEELVDRAKNGDKSAFDELIINMQSDLYKVARMRLYCEDDINDAVQETIIKAYKNIKKIKQPQYFKTWLIKVLINNCNKIYKKSYRNDVLEYNEDISTNSYSINDDEKIKNLDFYYLIENLNYKEREALTLYYLFDFTTKEISKIIKEPESTIRNRIARTKSKLRKKCKGENYNGWTRFQNKSSFARENWTSK